MIGENFVGKEVVLAILNKSADAVTDAELAILKARISYLTAGEQARYGIGEEEEESPKPKKKKK